MGRIGIQQQMAQLSIEQPKADLTIEQPKADLSIETVKGKLTIDQSQVWADMNLMPTTEWNYQWINEAKQIAQEGVARRAEEGIALIDIQNGDNAIVELAIQNGHRHPKTLTIDYIPSVFAVKINYQPSELNIDVQENKPKIDVQINKPMVDFKSGHVDIWMEQYPSIEIDVVG